jgi:hypothetical protein
MPVLPQVVGDNQTGAYCPMCRNQGSPSVMAMRDNVDCFCLMGHRMPHAQFWSMKPDMIKTDVRFQPGPHDVKVEVWVNGEVLQRSKEALGERWHPTIASLIRACMAGVPILIDGQQAEKLRKLGVKNGAEMVATAELNIELSGQNETHVAKINEWEDRFKDALAGVGR